MTAPALVDGLAVAILAVCDLPGDALRRCEEQIRLLAVTVHFDEDADDCTPEGNALLAVAEAIDLFLFDRAALNIARTLFNELGAGDRTAVAEKGEAEARAWFAAHGVDRPGGAAAQLVALCRYA